MDLNCDPQNRTTHIVYKRPSRESVKPLIEFVMSADDSHMHHNESVACTLLSRSNQDQDWYTEAGAEPSLP